MCVVVSAVQFVCVWLCVHGCVCMCVCDECDMRYVCVLWQVQYS